MAVVVSSSKGFVNSSLEVSGPRHDGTLGETDPVILARRQRQIDFGINSPSYQNYISHIPKKVRCHGCPNTPDRYKKASRRGFDGIIRKWKISVHEWSDAIDIVEGKRRFGILLPPPHSSILLGQPCLATSFPFTPSTPTTLTNQSSSHKFHFTP